MEAEPVTVTLCPPQIPHGLVWALAQLFVYLSIYLCLCLHGNSTDYRLVQKSINQNAVVDVVAVVVVVVDDDDDDDDDDDT